jgi:iron complex transport system ATP-binding protein
MLALSHLSAAYGQRPILRDITLTLKAGEVLALVGPNGAGKSTLIKVISGVLSPRAGRAQLDGRDLTHLAPLERAKRVAVVPQMARLPAGFTVGEIVLMGRAPHLPLWANESARDCEVAWQAMRRAQIETLVDRRAEGLSGGEQQRVVLARALAQQPRVLLLDEPTAHLDLKHQIAVLDLVRSLAVNENLAVLLTLHDLNQAARYADRVALLHNGALTACDAPQAVLTAERLSAIYGVPVAIGAHPHTGAPLVIV